MRLTRSDIVNKLADIFRAANGNESLPEGFSESSNLHTDLGMTSVGMLYIVIVVEEMFGISFDDKKIDDFVTLKDVVDYIEHMQ